ncbi:cyclin-D3-2-like [Phragmites australis]|uniref:cyclin-D3-2-like n=1 Tax=Phragmites australis TaxID=29695 RepID=UPI002D77102C|nr:cyclin-D3-2-like [Phragmites australis]
MAFATLFDPLYCPEEHLDLYQEPGEDEEQQQRQRAAALDDELPALLEVLRGKEGVMLVAEGEEDGYGGAAGREAAVGWACRAAARLGFSALTAALAAAYLDRCFLGGALRLGGRPWMSRLAAVACVALAAKVEETRVPLLLDLQLCAAADADAGEAYVFEAKTVRRMELLVLSALGWRMHPVTPFSYLQPLLADAAVRLHHCESVLLAVMADCRWSRHRPSAWAAAALLATAGSSDNDVELLALINAPEDEVDECAKIISESMDMNFLAVNGDGSIGNKRKHAAARMYSPPLSPSGVIGALSCFSCESSSSASADSRSPATVAAWPLAAPVSVSSTLEPPGRPPKRAASTAALPLPPDEESRDAWPSTCAA